MREEWQRKATGQWRARKRSAINGNTRDRHKDYGTRETDGGARKRDDVAREKKSGSRKRDGH